MISTTKNTITEAYLSNLQKILKHGTLVEDERGGEVLEVQNLHTTINFNKPTIPLLEGSVWNKERLVEYSKQMLDPNLNGFVYTYGNRLRGFDIDQIQYIVDKLAENQNTRRATAVTWRPTVDTANDEVPCLIMIDCKVRKGMLTLTAVFRSNDMYGASYANLWGLSNIAETIARLIDVKVKCIECHHISAHIYEKDIPSAEELLKQNKVYL